MDRNASLGRENQHIAGLQFKVSLSYGWYKNNNAVISKKIRTNNKLTLMSSVSLRRYTLVLV